jgi:hypothetical protein
LRVLIHYDDSIGFTSFSKLLGFLRVFWRDIKRKFKEFTVCVALMAVTEGFE